MEAVMTNFVGSVLRVLATGAVLVGLLSEVDEANAQLQPTNKRQGKPAFVIQLEHPSSRERISRPGRPAVQSIGKASPGVGIERNNALRNKILGAIKQDPRIQAARQRIRSSAINFGSSMTNANPEQESNPSTGTCNSGAGTDTTTDGDHTTQTDEETLPTDNGSSGNGTCPTRGTDPEDELPADKTGTDPADADDDAIQVEGGAELPSDDVAEEQAESQPLVIVSGSELTLDGNSLGQAKGTVRLRVVGIGLPVSVLDWSNTKASIRLPKFELARPLKAELEVVRADGVLISKSPIKLAPSGTRLVVRQTQSP